MLVDFFFGGVNLLYSSSLLLPSGQTLSVPKKKKNQSNISLPAPFPQAIQGLVENKQEIRFTAFARGTVVFAPMYRHCLLGIMGHFIWNFAAERWRK